LEDSDILVRCKTLPGYIFFEKLLNGRPGSKTLPG